MADRGDFVLTRPLGEVVLKTGSKIRIGICGADRPGCVMIRFDNPHGNQVHGVLLHYSKLAELSALLAIATVKAAEGEEE